MTQDPVLELNYSTGLSARQLQHLLYVTKMEHLSENHHFSRLRKKCFSRRSVTAAAKAGAENKPVIAAVNRCATQKQAQTRLFPQAVKRYPDTKPHFSGSC
jgi:hypothetical protein